MPQFRFMELEIWKDSITLNEKLFSLADEISDAKSFRFAEQLRAASLSISNNIAEGAGSYSDRDFANFLNIARRSVFETANLVFIAHQQSYIDTNCLNSLLLDLDVLSRKISKLRMRLRMNEEKKR
ncbi:four helix bundle protein [Thermophagus sp. OGC60D27]|uniref:four helix bundle protein n=1 Tax=Thermophagus sp. OGC60D27 TaxID=3458415 RepID=UPI0040378819